MTKEEFSKMLNGRNYRQEMTTEEELLAKESGLLVCFGASDDLLEFRGIIYDEADVSDFTPARLAKKKGGEIGILPTDEARAICDLMNQKGFKFSIKSVNVEAMWCPKELECSWLIRTDLPCAEFDILEDGELYCRGIVIDVKDIENALN